MREEHAEQALVARARRRLEAELGLALPEGRLPLGRKRDGTPRQHRFDLVATDRAVLGEVRTYTLGEGGNRPSGKFAHCYAACLFLYRARARRKLLVLTDRQFWARFHREADGVVEGIEIVHVPLDLDAPLVTEPPPDPEPPDQLRRAPRPVATTPPRRNKGGPGPRGRRPNTGRRPRSS